MLRETPCQADPSLWWVLDLEDSRRLGQVTTAARKLYEADDRLVWAGEHCCMAFFGYMEAALQSGLHAAQAIARAEGIPEANTIWEARMIASAAQPE